MHNTVDIFKNMSIYSSVSTGLCKTGLIPIQRLLYICYIFTE